MSKAQQRKIKRLLEKGMTQAERDLAEDIIRRGYGVTSAIHFIGPLHKIRVAMTERLMADHWPGGEIK